MNKCSKTTLLHSTSFCAYGRGSSLLHVLTVMSLTKCNHIFYQLFYPRQNWYSEKLTSVRHLILTFLKSITPIFGGAKMIW